MTQALDVEVRTVPDSPLLRLIDESGVEQSTAVALRNAFQPLMDILEKPISEAMSIVVTEATQLTEMRLAGEKRKEIKTGRVAALHAKKELKKDLLAKGKAVEDVFKWIEAQCDKAEAHLLAQENFAKNAEAERKAKLKAARVELLVPFNVDTTYMDMANMTEAAFATLLESTKLAHEARIAAAAKLEADRIAAEQARITEEKRIREENARLQREAEEAAKAAAAERAKAEAERKAIEDQARKERQEAERLAAAERARVEAEKRAAEEVARKEREAIEAKARAEQEAANLKAEAARKEAEAKAQAEHDRLQAIAAKEKAERERLEQAERERVAAELAKKKAEADAAKKAAKAPDKAKVAAIADALNAIALPECATPEGKELTRKIGMEIINLAERVKAMAGSL